MRAIFVRVHTALTQVTAVCAEDLTLVFGLRSICEPCEWQQARLAWITTNRRSDKVGSGREGSWRLGECDLVSGLNLPPMEPWCGWRQPRAWVRTYSPDGEPALLCCGQSGPSFARQRTRPHDIDQVSERSETWPLRTVTRTPTSHRPPCRVYLFLKMLCTPLSLSLSLSFCVRLSASPSL